MVEFALVLPMLLLIVTGILGLGIVINQFEVLTNAVSVGARAFALSRAQSATSLATTDPCAYAVGIMEAAAPSLNSSNMTFTITVTPPNGSTSTYSSSCSGDGLTANDIGGTATMEVQYPVSTLVYGWAGKTLNLTAQTAEQMQ